MTAYEKWSEHADKAISLNVMLIVICFRNAKIDSSPSYLTIQVTNTYKTITQDDYIRDYD